MLKLFSQLRSFAEVFGELKNLDSADGNYEKHESILRSNWSDFRQGLEKQIEEQDTSDKLSIFIRSVQRNLTSFSNKIFVWFKENENSDCLSLQKIAGLFREIGTDISELLDFFEDNYPKYFDLNNDISLWKIYDNKEVQVKCSQIIRNLEQRNVEQELIEIVKEYLGILYNTSSRWIKDWARYSYIETLSNELKAFSQTSNEEDITLKLIKLLIGYDFNTILFYEYMLRYSVRVSGTDMPYEDREMELLVLLKTIEDIRPECKHGYNKNVPPIGPSVSDSIKRDLKNIEKMKIVYLPNYPGSKGKSFTNFYYEVNATLEELFFLVRIMLEVHFIKIKFKSSLYAFIERHVRTTRTKTPSPKYMRNIFGPTKTVPVRVIKSIRIWLVMMINYIDTKFGDLLKVWPFGLISISIQEDIINLCLLTI